MATIWPATSIPLLLCLAMIPTLAESLQIEVENNTGEALYLRLVYADPSSGLPNWDSPPLAPNSTARINITCDGRWRLFGATSCSLHSSGRPMNCSTGDCGPGGCTLEDQPIANMLASDNCTLKPTTVMGYNLAFDGQFLCPDCPSFACVIPLHTCPKNLAIFDDSGSIVGCKPGLGFPSGKGCPALDSYSHLPSHGVTCPFEDVILKLSFRSVY